jgi:endonuclease/exonuclease/phosphatase family metal-dependent hydrolase
VDPTDDPVTLRVMVFNIEDGGVGVDFGKVVEAIRRADPDVVALQEAMGNTARIAEALGWAFASHRTQILSRHPLFDPAAGEPGPAFVEVRPGRVVALSSVHLPAEPYGPDAARQGGSERDLIALERRIRLPRLERSLAALPPLVEAGIPVFLAGDFNAPSHLDWTAATVGLRPHLRTRVGWPVSRAIEAAGFRDAWREIHVDPVTHPGLTWWADRPPTGGYEPGADTPDDRIDAIYAAGPSTTTDCRIVGEIGRADVAIGVVPWPSDHRAVVATFDVTPAPMPHDPGEAVPSLSVALRAPEGPTRFESTKSVYRLGEPIDVRWWGGPGYRWDWIAVFETPAEDLRETHRIWMHTGARIDGTVRLDDASAVVDQSPVGGRWPLPPGPYEVAYLLDDAPRALARVPFTIVA